MNARQMFNRIKEFIRPSQAPTAPQFVIVPRDPFRLTTTEWKASLDLVKVAQRALANPDVRQMLDALRNSHLSRFASVGTIEQRALHLSRCEGYGACLNDFEDLAIFLPPKEDVEATFPQSDDEP